MTKGRNKILKQAAAAWREQGEAAKLDCQKQLCERAARSLELEVETGVAHCACHLYTIDKCRAISTK